MRWSRQRIGLPKLTTPMLRGLWPLAMIMTCALGGVSYVRLAMYLPADARLAEQEAAYQAGKQTLARLQTTRTQQEQVKAAKEQVEKEQQQLPTQNEFSTLAVSIAELGQAEQVVIPGMTYSLQKKDTGGPVKATMAFKVTGSYASMYRFIQRLEHTKSYVVIESLDATRMDHREHEKGGLLVFNMKVATFLRPNGEAVKPAS